MRAKMRASGTGPACALSPVQEDYDLNRNYGTPMMPSTSQSGARAARGPRRNNQDRRSRGRLRELCDEVLASYRIAQGEDLVTAEDREVADQLLRNLAPQVAR